MKRGLLVAALMFVSVTMIHAQISITADDFTSQLTLGRKVTTDANFSVKTADIGSPGATSWDFNSLTSESQFVTESKTKSSSTYNSKFPNSEYASYYEGTFEGVFSQTWVYNTIGPDFYTDGTGTFTSPQGLNTTAVITFSPKKMQYKLPFTLNDTWTYTGSQSIATTVTVPFLGETTTTLDQNLNVTYTVDAYGKVTMPGGKVLDALRIKEVSTLTWDNNTSTSVIYHIITKTGESVNITVTDHSATSGVVGIDAISWTDGDGVSSPGGTTTTVNAPTSLSAIVSNGKIDLMWTDNADNEDGYTVERAEGSGSFSVIAQLGANASSYTDTNIQNGVEYHFKVQGHSGSTISDYSNVADAVGLVQVTVSAPTNLSAAASDGKINLTWTDNADNEDGYTVERAEGAGSFNTVAQLSANTNSYTDTNVQNGVEYHYKVQGHSGSINSDYSNVADAVGFVQVTVSAPTNLSATVSEGKIDLTWTDNADNEDGYTVERAEGSGSFNVVAQLGANTNSYTDTNVKNGIEYHYKVQGHSGSTNSDYSNVANATGIVTDVAELNNGMPTNYSLSQNYPNPFNPTTQITFSIPKNSFVSLKIYDVTGAEVRDLVNRELSAGKYSIDFNASNLVSGIYLYKITANNFLQIKKMMLVK